MAKRLPKQTIGWAEWCSLPELGLPVIKAKVDTGAKTSALHAFDIKTYTKDGERFVRFKIHPLQGDNKTVVECVAPLFERRAVTSSNGEREMRYVIKTPIEIADRTVKAELTLTSRHKMTFRMLLGREALRRARMTVDPAKTMILGRKRNPEKNYTDTAQTSDGDSA